MPSTQVILRVDQALPDLRSELEARCTGRAAALSSQGRAPNSDVILSPGEFRLPAAHTIEFRNAGPRDEIHCVGIVLPEIAISQLCEQRAFGRFMCAVSLAVGLSTDIFLAVQCVTRRKRSEAVLQGYIEAVTAAPKLLMMRQTSSIAETATLIISVAEYFSSGSSRKFPRRLCAACKRKSMHDPRRAFVDMLAEIPGITDRTAVSILPLYPSLASLCSAVIADDPMTGLSNSIEFGTSRKMGRATVEALRSALMQNYATNANTEEDDVEEEEELDIYSENEEEVNVELDG